MIEVKNLCKKYKSKNGDVIAANNINLEFKDSGLIFILGKSGSGKTTLLNLMAGMDEADSGNIITDFYNDNNIDDILKFTSEELNNYYNHDNMDKAFKENNNNQSDILNFTQNQLDIYHNVHMGFVFQDYYLIDNWSVKDNILISLQQQRSDSTKTHDERLEKILNYVGLDGVSHRKVSELSGGQAQRVAIARALIKNPKVIFADEPTGNLDSKSGHAVFKILKEISKSRLVIVVTHDEKSANEYADRMIKISDGTIISDENLTQNDMEYKLVISDNNGNNESVASKNLETIKNFLCNKVLLSKNSKHIIDFKQAKTEEKQK